MAVGGARAKLSVLYLAFAMLPLASVVASAAAHPTSAFVRQARPLHSRSQLLALSGGGAGQPVGQTPITSLLELCKEACDELSVLVRLVYAGMRAEDAALKADKSVFTIADGLVQHLLQTTLLREDVLCAIVGEEDSIVNVLQRPYTVDALPVPEALWPVVDSARAKLLELSAKLGSDPALRLLTAFVDPIDGTREFTERLGEMCTICIGFSEGEKPIGGLVYRPLTTPASWAYGCEREGTARSQLLATKEALAVVVSSPIEGEPRAPADGQIGDVPISDIRLLVSRGSLSPFLRALGRQLPAQLVRSGGAGNKALLLLEGAADCYIQDRGLFRWDTCASQAVLEAHGGVLVKLTALASRGELESYRYEKTVLQLDFEPGLVRLSAYNAANRNSLSKGAVQFAESAEQTKPYANVCGVCALAPRVAGNVGEFSAAVARARDEHEWEIS